MKHLFVPYDLAVKLKTKGFDEPCFTKFEQYFNKKSLQAIIGSLSLNGPYELEYNGYDQKIINSEQSYHFTGYKNSVLDHGQEILAAPLYAQAIDFLRKKHDVHVTNTCHFTTSGDVAGYIFDICYQDDLLKRKASKTVESSDYYNALNKAIEEALQLIK